ncbi:MAG: hypothetical protein ACI9VT_001375 [Psychroserpens sp.]|jgi:hypothetical protein
MTFQILPTIDAYKQHKGSTMKNHNPKENQADTNITNKKLLKQCKSHLNYIWKDGLDLFGRISALVTIIAWMIV